MQSIASPESNLYWTTRLAKMPIPHSIRSNKLLYSAYSELSSRGRISESTGLLLMDEAPLSGLTALASMVKHSKHSDDVFFNKMNLFFAFTNYLINLSLGMPFHISITQTILTDSRVFMCAILRCIVSHDYKREDAP